MKKIIWKKLRNLPHLKQRNLCQEDTHSSDWRDADVILIIQCVVILSMLFMLLCNLSAVVHWCNILLILLFWLVIPSIFIFFNLLPTVYSRSILSFIHSTIYLYDHFFIRHHIIITINIIKSITSHEHNCSTLFYIISLYFTWIIINTLIINALATIHNLPNFTYVPWRLDEIPRPGPSSLVYYVWHYTDSRSRD